MITSRIMRVPMENIDLICSFESELSLGFISSIEILDIFEVIDKMLNLGP